MCAQIYSHLNQKYLRFVSLQGDTGTDVTLSIKIQTKSLEVFLVNWANMPRSPSVVNSLLVRSLNCSLNELVRFY